MTKAQVAVLEALNVFHHRRWVGLDKVSEESGKNLAIVKKKLSELCEDGSVERNAKFLYRLTATGRASLKG